MHMYVFSSDFCQDFLFVLVFYSLHIMHLDLLISEFIFLGILLVFWICGLVSVSNFGEFPIIIILNISLALLYFFLPLLTLLLLMCYIFWSFPTVLLYFSSIFMQWCISVGRFILTYPQANWFFPGLCSSVDPIKCILISVIISSISF